MNFKKMTISIFVLLNMANVSAQQQFYNFRFNDKDGLSDDKGNEIVAPIYDYWRISENGKLYIFHPDFSSDEKTLSFDITTKQSKKYKSFYEDQVAIQNENHHLVNETGDKSYFLNAETGAIVNVKEDIYNAENLGKKHIIAKYSPKEVEISKLSSSAKNKGNFIPPPVVSTDYEIFNYIIYSNEAVLKPLAKIKAEKYFLLNKAKPEPKADKNGNIMVEIVTIDLNDKKFDYVLFQNAKIFELYDKNFKLLQKITTKNSIDGPPSIPKDVIAKCEAIIGNKLERENYGGYPSVGNSSREKMAEPDFVVENVGNNYQLFKKMNGEKKAILASPYRLEYASEGKIRIENEKEDKATAFKFNETTLQLYIPQKYLELLGVKKLN